MYSESWSSKFATNNGQYRGSDHYLIEYSYAFSNSTDPGMASPDAAVHQASKDVAYSTLQSFCSSYLGPGKPADVPTIIARSIPMTAVTRFQTTTATITASNAAGTLVSPHAKRSVASLSTPKVLAKYHPESYDQWNRRRPLRHRIQ
jgi:hypothetical protein